MNCKDQRNFTFYFKDLVVIIVSKKILEAELCLKCYHTFFCVIQKARVFVKKLEKKKLWKKGLVVCSACQGLASLLIKNSYSCLFFHKKVHSTLLTKCVYANECVCKGFGMTTHMDQQITWANNRVPLLCQHRSYSTTKCLWSSWYHLEMGGTTLLSEQGGGQHDTNRIWLLLAKWKMAFLHPNRGGHLTSRSRAWLFAINLFIDFSRRVLRAIKHRF